MGDQEDGTLDLEKELSCSICTDVFYQPLTLLDCLHTFCGSCLKEWFSWQASAATSEHPYTCPACRAFVRGTRPNATVTTLLEMLLKAHPQKAKSREEKEEIERTYRPGDDVIPPVHVAAQSDDSEDGRWLERARELSLEDLDSRGATSRRPHGSNSHGRHRRRHERDGDSEGWPSYRPEQGGGTPQRRQLDHQSSLRSLLSASEPDSLAIQEEIMHQIMDEGLLDGIDLNNLTSAQEEEITERIARAFRTRQMDHRDQRDHSGSRPRSRERVRQSPPSAGRHSRQPSSTPPSRPHHRASDSSRGHRSRTSSHASQTSVRSAAPATRSDEALVLPRVAQPASRSATDLSQRTNHHHPRRREQSTSQAQRRTTDPDIRTEHVTSHPQAAPSRPIPRRDVVTSSPSLSRDATVSTRAERPASPPLASRSVLQPANSSSPALVEPSSASLHVMREETRPATSSATPLALVTATSTALAPSLSCHRCGKPDIQHSLHYSCSTCSSGNLNLCLSCYRAGKGCLNWYGFGYAAFAKYAKLAQSERYPSGLEPPHILSARIYLRKTGFLQEGLFCEGCFSYTDQCYWHCQICNDGAWGFCNDCVQTGKHCTHPLQCIGNVSTTTRRSFSGTDEVWSQDLHPAPLQTTKTALRLDVNLQSPTMARTALPHVPDPSHYATMTLTVFCDICQLSIPPSHTRYHCHTCNKGNYDICSSCYHAAGSSGRMKPEDGAQGWRRCPRGHRMSVIGFEDREGGPRRLVVRDIVGGWALKEDRPRDSKASQSGPTPIGQWRWKEEDGTSASQVSTTRNAPNTMPPDGGTGLRTIALWSHFPAESVQDELAFPRNAVITEVENINGDWFWGIYAGKSGLFPGNFVRII